MATGGQQTISSGVTAPPSSFPLGIMSTPQSDAVQSKRDLTSWWKNFKRGNTKVEDQHKGPQGIFGVPLAHSIRYANVAISLFDDKGQSYIYGYVPIVVAKCGVFLKEKATETEGIFRLAGSQKRIKELEAVFDSPEKYGKGLDWTGYTVHDASNILRRYFNQLPEPIIPLDFYERFRGPLRSHQQAELEQTTSAVPVQTAFDAEAAIKRYQGLITELPPLNRQLLLYILDLLAVFASKADFNKMTTPNLSAIFQPGILSHPQHDMSPEEYRLSQDVLVFLIENQDSFLIGMHGTAADEKTVQEVQGTYQANSQPTSPSTTPTRSRTVVGRTSSNASGNSQGRRPSGLRRNLSSSSRTSRQSNAQVGRSPSGSRVTLSGGIHRSNTVPSQRSSGASPRYGREKKSGPPTPLSGVHSPVETDVMGRESEQIDAAANTQISLPTQTPASPAVMSASSSEATTPLAAPPSSHQSAGLAPVARDEPQSSLLTPEVARRGISSDRSSTLGFLDRLRQGSASDGEKRDNSSRQSRKLQKKRIPGSSLSSAASSANDLGHDLHDTAESIASLNTPQYRDTDPMSEYQPESATKLTTAPPKENAPQRALAEALRSVSPHHTARSISVTDASESEFLDDVVASEKQEKKRRWRFSHSAKSRNAETLHDATRSMPTMPNAVVGSTLSSANPSRAGSNATAAHNPPADATETDLNSSHESEERRKGPVSWIKGKIQERKEKEAVKRSKSPGPVLERRESRKSAQMPREEASGHAPVVFEPREPAQLPVMVPHVASTAATSAATQQAASHSGEVPVTIPRAPSTTASSATIEAAASHDGEAVHGALDVLVVGVHPLAGSSATSSSHLGVDRASKPQPAPDTLQRHGPTEDVSAMHEPESSPLVESTSPTAHVSTARTTEQY